MKVKTSDVQNLKELVKEIRELGTWIQLSTAVQCLALICTPHTSTATDCPVDTDSLSTPKVHKLPAGGYKTYVTAERGTL